MRAKCVSEFHKAISFAGAQADGYTGHSFRFGAATMAVAKRESRKNDKSPGLVNQ